MYQILETILVWIVSFSFFSCPSAIRYALCLPTAWEYAARAMLALGISLLLSWSVKCFHRHVDRVPGWMTSVAVGQIVLITGAFFWSDLNSSWLGTVTVGVCAIWSLQYARREAQAAIDEVRNSGWMRAWRMVEQK